MKVYIVATPNVPSELSVKICNTLNSVCKNIEFTLGIVFTENQIKRLASFTENKEEQPVSFNALFEVCELFRFKKDLDENPFVILLTDYRNSENWLSAVKDKNVFIYINDWELITGKERYLGVAYQVIENVFQSMLGISYDEIDENKDCIHSKPIGCINDFCENKSDVILKLRTADICPNCLTRSKELNVPTLILSDIQSAMEHIRNEIKYFNINSQIEPETVQIGRKGSIKIGDKVIKLEPLQKTLFIFFLTCGAVKLNDLKEYQKTIRDIYLKIRPSGKDQSLENLIQPAQHKDSTFLKNLSALNKSLTSQLGKPLADFYLVKKSNGDAYKVRITPDSLDLRPEF